MRSILRVGNSTRNSSQAKSPEAILATREFALDRLKTNQETNLKFNTTRAVRSEERSRLRRILQGRHKPRCRGSRSSCLKTRDSSRIGARPNIKFLIREQRKLKLVRLKSRNRLPCLSTPPHHCQAIWIRVWSTGKRVFLTRKLLTLAPCRTCLTKSTWRTCIGSHDSKKIKAALSSTVGSC